MSSPISSFSTAEIYMSASEVSPVARASAAVEKSMLITLTFMKRYHLSLPCQASSAFLYFSLFMFKDALVSSTSDHLDFHETKPSITPLSDFFCFSLFMFKDALVSATPIATFVISVLGAPLFSRVFYQFNSQSVDSISRDPTPQSSYHVANPC